MTRRAGLSLVVVLALAALGLRGLGRVWWCACGSSAVWAGDVNSPHNSQHLLDPYSLSHVLHGFLFYLLLWLALGRRTSLTTRFALALSLEALWELLENTSLIIDRYRTATISLDYYGDSVLNSLADIICCGAGYALAAWLPVWGSVGFCLGAEITLLLWIRDSLLLNIWMLVWPSAALRQWQQGTTPF